MARASRSFQVFVKPAGAACNLACGYCYYRLKDERPASGPPGRMPDDLLEDYIVQHFEASPDEIVRFSWHGGEPTLLGLDYFRRIAVLQRRHAPPGRMYANGLQTNGVLIDDVWGRFLAEEDFAVGLSLDGPAAFHDRHRRGRDGSATFEAARRGWEILGRHGVGRDILCVVGADTVESPAEVYGFFKDIGAPSVSFLPLVEPRPDRPGGVSARSAPPEAWGDFLIAVFDEWEARDIGRIKVQIFEEAARTAFGREHSLCLFRPECGDIPVLERDGSLYACDHFMDPGHRIGGLRESRLLDLLESPALRAFGRRKRETLPRTCLDCEVLAMCHGECPKNRFARSPDGEAGANYLCPGYRRFFEHIRPFVDAVAAAWRNQASEMNRPAAPAAALPRPGRNDPCLCGSGAKYKKCCGAA